MKKFLITLLATLFVFYLLSAFVTLSFNPVHWGWRGRASFAFAGVLISLCVTGIITTEKNR
jgi:hypothetical protein